MGSAFRPQPEDPAAFFDALLREDFGLFLSKAFETLNGGKPMAKGWHLDAIVQVLELVRTGKCLRLLVTMPPRNLKSIAISVAWVAWMLGRDPTLKFMCVSYSSELADKLARMCRILMQTEWYKRVFPGTRLSSRSAIHDFETTAGGGRFATSITGTVTGRGGGIVIIDDPIKPEDAMSETVRNNVNEAYRSTLASRLDDKATNPIICVMQRLHQEDLAGIMLEEGGWTHLNLPAIATEDQIVPLTRGRVHTRKVGDVLHPAREPLEVLERLKRQMGSVLFTAQYQQQPVPAGGNLILAEWLREVPTIITRQPGDLVVQSLDTASKDGVQNDWSVSLTAIVRGRDVYLIHVARARLAFPDLLNRTIALAREYRPDALLIEDAASGTQLYQTLIDQDPIGVPRPLGRRAESDKVSRLSGVSAMIEAGQLILPKEAPWLADFKGELLAFPNGRHDDQVDALSQMLEWVRRNSRFDTIGPPPEVPSPRNIPGGDDLDDDCDDEDYC